MKEYCVDLEIAKELKKNGFPQETVHWWVEDINTKEIQFDRTQYPTGSKSFCSPISDEILKELPSNFIYKGNHYWLYIIKDNENNYQVYYEKTLENGFDPNLKFRIINKKLSNCLALTWLYLKKEGHIK